MSVSVVVLLNGLPVTVIVELPTGVVAAVAMVSVLVHVGLQEGAEKLAVAPLGRPEALRLTAWVVPVRRVAVIVLVPLLPWRTLMVPEFVRL